MSQNGAASRPSPRASVTLHDIARRLDVSTATVSLALRGAPVVADTTRARVQALARELGYSYNRSAASLRTARSNTLAASVHDLTKPVVAEMLSAFEDAAAAAGQTVLLGSSGEDPARQDRVLATLREYRPDGMLVCPAAGSPLTAYDPLVAAGIPLVQLGREIGDPGLDYAGGDDAAAMELAVDHLVGLGHRRIAMIGGLDGVSTGRGRRRAYRDALTRRGIAADPALMVEGEGSRETGFSGVSRLLAGDERPSAAVCFDDQVAFGALLGLQRAGLAPGRDLSIVGHDDLPEASLWSPGLTTLRARPAEAALQAARRLLHRIAAPDAAPWRWLAAPELVVRGSTGAA